ncbi:MAG TPA: amidohydrolase, partial [Bacteroidia bacterium]|nr:amidohydrolase [Bacteroidia bacterium]
MNNKIKIIFILLTTITIYVAKAQNPAPSAFNQKSMLLRGGIAHIGNGTVIENSLIGITKGKIDFVYDATTVKLQPMNYDT